MFSNDILDLTHKCATFRTINSKSNQLQSLSISDLDRREKMDSLSLRFETANKNFLIHYTLTGLNAISADDFNKNGIPDYIDSVAFYCEYVYQKEVIEMGYNSPVPDSGLGGSLAYDIYLVDLGKQYGGYYGVTFPDDNAVGSSTKKSHSYIVIDNNYSEEDNYISINDKVVRTYFEEPWMCLKITIAHEFHHAIQFRYGLNFENKNIPELTSSSMENRLFPGSRDFTSYLRNLLKYPTTISLADTDPISGYSLATFGTMMNKLLGDSFLKKTWEISLTGVKLFNSLDSAAFLLSNKHIDEYWCIYTNWLYHTGKHSIEGQYFDNAITLPEMKFENLSDTNNSNIYFQAPQEIYSNSLMPLSYLSYRKILISNSAITNDTIDIVVSNTDLIRAKQGGISRQMLLENNYPKTIISLANEPQNNFKQAENLKYYYNVYADNSHCEYQYSNIGISSDCFSYSYPTPVILNKDNSIVFSAPCNYKPFDFDKPNLKIMNLDFSVAFSGFGVTELVENKKIIRLNNPEKYLKSGVYYYTVEFKGEQVAGKISVIEK